ncbi:hypothetical protein EVG20_g5378 [Dentipellis fragilis]|uniref:Uncharacterized protein n=1 Tax=Dentipellis fragilis TaxID=205917 RepID=A0A4Y9YVU6_9AGAM|nr:hypothetical protein EVG20_g5378 [Dentipellis fragilis]
MLSLRKGTRICASLFCIWWTIALFQGGSYSTSLPLRAQSASDAWSIILFFRQAVLSAMELPFTDQKLSSTKWPRSHYCFDSRGHLTRCHYSKTQKLVGAGIGGVIVLVFGAILIYSYCQPWCRSRRTPRSEVRLQELPSSSGNVQQPEHPGSVPPPSYTADASIKRPDEEPVYGEIPDSRTVEPVDNFAYYATLSRQRLRATSMTSFVEVLARAAKKTATKAAKKTKTVFVTHTIRQCYDAHQQRIPCPTTKTGRIVGIVLASIVGAIAIVALGVWLFCRFKGRRTERGVADSEAPVDAAEREEAAQPLTQGAEHHEQDVGPGYPPYQYPRQSTDTLPPYDDKKQEADYPYPAYEPKLPMPSYHGQS